MGAFVPEETQVIGWIGAGRMGVPMAGFILKAGYPVLVYNRAAPLAATN